ncbi:MAG TPA: hypothetical protein VJ914_01315 [Pseudonocardiaceae bacterium]|nr:hypothetical protein [Pseudonocardiaceae bacterium]
MLDDVLLKAVLRKLRNRTTPLATGGRVVCVVVLLGVLTGLGFAMNWLVGHMALAAGEAGTPGVLHVQQCQMVTDSSDPSNHFPRCTGLFQPSAPSVAANPYATLSNGQLYPDGSTVQVSSDGSDTVIGRSAKRVRFYLGWVLWVLCFMLLALVVLLPAIVTGWFYRFPRTIKGAMSLRVGVGALVVAGGLLVVLDV